MRPSPTSLAPCISLPTLAGLLCALLGGCSLSSTVGPTPDAGLALQGRVFGGQEPIVGASVYLYAANTTGYGGAGIAASTNNASISLLTSVPGSTTQDSSGDYYVTTDNTGTFTITGDYTCTPNAQVYLYTLGGSQGGVANSIAQLLAVLGNCPSSCSFPTETPYVVVNEVTTVAAAYALAGFMTNATHVVEFRHGACANRNRECVCECGESGRHFHGNCAGDDSGGQWDGAAGGDQHAGEYPGGMREFEWRGVRADQCYGVLHVIRQPNGAVCRSHGECGDGHSAEPGNQCRGAVCTLNGEPSVCAGAQRPAE